ncbi:MAG: SRPBCC family protein [Thermonemataceae bacterium]
MNFLKETIIDQPIHRVWEVLGHQFGEAYRWASSLIYSESYGTPVLEGATCSNRACDTTQGKIKEVLRKIDHDHHILTYEVMEGFPFFVDTAINTWSLTPKGNQTIVTMNTVVKMKGLMGSVMTPLMKMQMNKLLSEALEDFQYYLEHEGQPHPRKQKQLEKMAAKVA